MKEAKERAKETYKVGNHFTPKVKKPFKKAIVKPRMFKNAEDEVNQYMKDLGLI